MKSKPLNLNAVIQPKITIRGLDANGREVWRKRTTNTLTRAAANVFATALSRSGPSQITHLYARFGTTGNPGFLAPSSGNILDTVRADFLEVPEGNEVLGGLWVPVLSTPVQSTDDAENYNGNVLTYYFRLPYNLSSDQISPADNFDVATSRVFSLGLAVAKDFSNRSEDIIISVLQAVGNDEDAGAFNDFLIPDGGQIAIDYVLPFSVELS